MSKQFLVADIGGTSSRFAHFSWDSLKLDSTPELISSLWLKTKEVNSFSELLEKLFASAEFSIKPEDIDCAVFAVAGPILKGKYCQPPNIRWGIDLDQVLSKFCFRSSFLINDFLAQAYSACIPQAVDAVRVLDGTAQAGTIAVVGAGTGLGKAIVVTQTDGSYLGVASEGGHANFAPESEREIEFMKFLSSRVKGSYPTWEDVVSGRGLSNIHCFLTGEELAPQEVAKKFAQQVQTLEFAARMYGRVCRNFALEVLSMGGLYIAGGVAAKNPSLLTHPSFAVEFRSSAVHGELLGQMPLYLINSEQSGLWGAAYFAGLRQKRLN